jgi:hypothetical protein
MRKEKNLSRVPTRFFHSNENIHSEVLDVPNHIRLCSFSDISKASTLTQINYIFDVSQEPSSAGHNETHSLKPHTQSHNW